MPLSPVDHEFLEAQFRRVSAGLSAVHGAATNTASRCNWKTVAIGVLAAFLVWTFLMIGLFTLYVGWQERRLSDAREDGRLVHDPLTGRTYILPPDQP